MVEAVTSANHSESQIAVVGAGLVGAVLSLYLARRGFRVTVYERGDDPRHSSPQCNRSVHLVLSVRGWKALRDIGIAEAVKNISLPLCGRRIHTETGKTAFQPYGTDGQCIDAVQRSELNRALVTFAAEHPLITIRFNQSCRDLDIETGTMTFEDRTTGSRHKTRAAVIIGADGAYSRVRLSMMLQADRFDFSQTYVPYGYRELSIPAASNGDFAFAPDAMHVWPCNHSILSAFPNHDHTFTATIVMPFEGNASFQTLHTEMDVRALFENMAPDFAALVPDLAEAMLAHEPSTMLTVRCAPWWHVGRESGHVALIGDAAHAMVPFLGQGMNAGFEDCTVLDGLIGDCDTDTGPDWTQVFLRYDELRRPNGNAISEMSLQNFHELSEHVGDPEFRRRKHLGQQIHRMYPTRYLPKYTMVAFSHLPYVDVKQRAGIQDEILTGVMNIAGADDDLNRPNVRQFIDRKIQALDPIETHFWRSS